jgi:hypothetical protein
MRSHIFRGLSRCAALAVGGSMMLLAQGGGARMPSLGFVGGGDSSQVIQIGGVSASPRLTGETRAGGPVLSVWSSPRGDRAVVFGEEGLGLVDGAGRMEVLIGKEFAELGAVTAAWDRGGDAFAACAGRQCRSFTAAGAGLGEWEAPGEWSLTAWSRQGGALYRDGGRAVLWNQGQAREMGEKVAAAAFQPGSGALWILEEDGRLRSSEGGGREEFLAGAVGMTFSSDGAALAAVTGEGLLQVMEMESGQTMEQDLEMRPEGLWAGPGRLTLRFQNSAKLPVGIWDVETKELAWAPAEVRQ